MNNMGGVAIPALGYFLGSRIMFRGERCALVCWKGR